MCLLWRVGCLWEIQENMNNAKDSLVAALDILCMVKRKNSQIYVQKKIDLFHNPVPGYKKGLYTSDPVGSLEYIKNDSKLKLKEDEWEYARKIAFKFVKENMKKRGGATDDELNSDEMKEYFKSLGFADLVENKNESNGKQLLKINRIKAASHD